MSDMQRPSTSKASSQADDCEVIEVPACSQSQRSGSDVVDVEMPNAPGPSSAEKIAPQPRAPGTILVNWKQKENPLLKSLRGPRAFDDSIEPDYVLGRGICAIFLSLKYHNLYPNYIYDRYKALGKSYTLRLLLILVDIGDVKAPLKEMTKFAILTESTLMLAWSYEEAARYLELYKAFENKSPEIIMEKQLANNKGTVGAYECVIEAIAGVKKINKTDAISLVSTFESLDRLMRATPEKLSLCPGLGPQKAEQLAALFNKPFVR